MCVCAGERVCIWAGWAHFLREIFVCPGGEWLLNVELIGFNKQAYMNEKN